MPSITMTVVECIDVPEGSRVLIAPTGAPMGVLLPGGALLRPWIVYEHGKDGDDPQDLTNDGLIELDVFVDIDIVRDFDGDIGELAA